MIAVIYSGSRNADWKLSDKGKLVSEFRTPGINPFLSDERSINHLLNKNNELIIYAEEIKKIYFYGAGATSKDRQQIIANAFTKFFRYSKVTVGHDLAASAIATCDEEPAIVGILGSGSNAAYFNGKRIKENNFGMGYILADEGSANWLGRCLLKDFLTGNLPEKFEHKFVQRFNPERKQILEKIYRHPQPVLFLTSFTDFLAENRQEPYVENLIKKGLNLFFETYILPLAQKHPGLPLHLTGAVADLFQDLLKELAEGYNIQIGNIIRKPIYNILNYYTNKN